MEKPVLAKIENKVRQQLFGLVSLVVVGLMAVNSLGLLVYGVDNQTNLTFNVSAGTFAFYNSPASMAFPAQTFGVANQVSGNEEVDGPVVKDYRGNSAAWSVAMNLVGNLTDGTNQINGDRLHLYQDTRGFLTNVENATTSRVTVGINGTLNGSGRTLINTSSSPGVVQYDNGFINLTFWSTDAAGNYFTTLYYTLS